MATIPQLISLAETTSTNDEVFRLAREGAPAFTAVRADVQTAGRGRKTHDWTSPAGGLYLSVLLRPRVSAPMLSGFSGVCGLAAVRAIQACGCSAARLKWPNDIVVGARKLSGMLLESQVSENDAFSVFGIGVNYQTPQVEKNSIGALPPIGLAECLDEKAELPSLDDLARAIVLELANLVENWEDAVASSDTLDGPLSPILSEYCEQLAFSGEEVQMVPSDGTEPLLGSFNGVDAQGRARFEIDGCCEQALESLDYSLRPIAPANEESRH